MPSPVRRVLLMPSWYPSPDLAVRGVFIEDQAKVLSERFDVLVLSQRDYGPRQVLRGRIPARAGFLRRDGVRVYEQTVFHVPKLPMRAVVAYRLARARAAMAAITREWGVPDIIHAHVVLQSGWIATRIGRAMGVPVVLTEHSGPFSSHLTSPSRRALVAETLKSCAKVLAVSPFLADQIGESHPGLRVEVVGNVVATRFFRPADGPSGRQPADTPLRLLSVSLLRKEKGQEYLLRAARMLMDGGFRKFELLIGGDGPDRSRLERLIRDLRLEETCRLLGMLTRDEVRDRMQQCDIFVLPSLAETFGMVIGEAMACGKPILSTRCGGADFQVTPATGILVAPGDSGALADGIRALDSKRPQYSPAAIRDDVTRRFGEAAFLESIARQYQEVLSGTAAAHGGAAAYRLGNA